MITFPKPFTFHAIVLFFTAFFSQIWVLRKDNFFLFDDFSHFMVVQSGFPGFSVLPIQMYNDRPVGRIFLYVFYNLFGLNHQWHHLAFLLVHILNAFLVYILARQVYSAFSLKDKLWMSLPVALIFSAWTRSTFVVSWSSAIFDLTGMLFSLLFLVTYFQFREKFEKKYLVLLIPFFFMMVRSKEATYFVGMIPLFLEVLLFLKTRVASWKLVIPVGLTLLSTCYCLSILLLRDSTGHMGFDEANPYHTVFTGEILLRNLARYTYLFFSVNETNFGYTGYRTDGLVLLALVCLSFFMAMILAPRIRLAMVFLGGCILATLLPVLPMVNMQLKLYLYIPSVFYILGSCLILATFFEKLPKQLQRQRFFVGLTVVMLFAVTLFSAAKLDRQWWLGAGRDNLVAWESLQRLPTPQPGDKIIMYGAENRPHIFLYGPGNAYRLFFDQRDITFILKSESEIVPADREEALILNYNEGKILLESTPAREDEISL